MLKSAGDPGLGNAPLPGARNVLPQEYDLTVVAPERAGNQVEYRALAGTVRSDQPDDFAGLDLKPDPADGFKTAEALEQAVQP